MSQSQPVILYLTGTSFVKQNYDSKNDTSKYYAGAATSATRHSLKSKKEKERNLILQSFRAFRSWVCYFSDTALAFFYPDAEGVASIDEILEKAGSLERYKELLTVCLVKNITDNYLDTSIVIFKGQARFNFIEDACNIYDVSKYRIILIDCAWKDIRLHLCNE
jgi:hypothetical protein